MEGMNIIDNRESWELKYVNDLSNINDVVSLKKFSETIKYIYIYKYVNTKNWKKSRLVKKHNCEK